MSSRQVTPENQKGSDIHTVGDDTPNPSIPICQSARKRTVIVTPGFVPTQSDSRRALHTNVPPRPKGPVTSASTSTWSSTAASNLQTSQNPTRKNSTTLIKTPMRKTPRPLNAQ
ncbi:hypothetical protein PtB15_8B770 [Puccinia triticina]|nr:hypothetical protein PtB15_8B770 [Puccinia triticina]